MLVLIADPNDVNREALAAQVTSLDYDVYTAKTKAHVLRHLSNKDYGCVLLSEAVAKGKPVELLRELREQEPEVALVLITDEPTVSKAVECVKAGANEFLQAPIPPETIAELLNSYKQSKNDRAKLGDIESHLSTSNPLISLQSLDREMKRIYKLAFRAADSDITMLLTGASGTGKTILAKNIHARSPRRDSPFVTVHCPSLKAELLESELFGHAKGSFTGAVSDTWGKVAAAEGGTLFLDEIGDLPPSIQAKLLRLIQEGCYERVGETTTCKADIRLITATNRDMGQEVAEGRFREDLFYRINVLTLELLPLNERKPDMEQFIDTYLSFYSKRLNHPNMRFSDDAMKCMLDYDWPGNLRELRNVIERATVLAEDKGTIGLDVLPRYLQRNKSPVKAAEKNEQPLPVGSDLSLEELETLHIKRTLEESPSKEDAATKLGIDTATLYRKRKRLGIE